MLNLGVEESWAGDVPNASAIHRVLTFEGYKGTQPHGVNPSPDPFGASSEWIQHLPVRPIIEPERFAGEFLSESCTLSEARQRSGPNQKSEMERSTLQVRNL
jgi:hypothetical protein